jgi:hypothetical protein
VSLAVVDSCPASETDNPREAVTNGRVPPAPISISLNSNPWPHVFHSEPAVYPSAESLDGAVAKSGNGATIVVYGLDPGRHYDVQLDAVAFHKGQQALHLSG